MPKKVDKIIDKVRGCKKVSMSIKNGQRWTYLKKHLGFVSDDELFDYLLDLADSIDEPDKKSSCENIQCTQEIDGQSSFIQNVDSLFLHRNLQRRCTRKFNVDDFSKTVCSEKSENVSNSLQNIGKVNKQEVKAFPKSCLEAAETKPYKNKSKCHRVKHKRKRQKTNNVNISATTSDKMILEKTLDHGSENNAMSNHSEVSSESMIDRSVTQFSKGSDDTHENNNIELPLDGKFENNSQYELETIKKQRENEDFLSCEKLSDSCQIERQESKTTAFIEESNQVLVDQISSTCESDDEKHNKTTEMTTRFKVSTMSQNDKTTHAHTDITISPLVDAKSVYSTKDIKSSTETLMPVVELCRNCNVQHSQVLCPLMEPDCMIEDSISLFDWINKYKNNYEITKVIDLNDPMSRGYSNGTNYNFESNEETVKENKVKDDMQCEEKQEKIHPNWPFFSRESLPSCLELKISNMDHGLGVFTKNQLPMYTQFGPLVGQIVQEMDIPDDYSMRHIWEVSTNDKTQYISTTNPLRSNWIRYIRPSETEDSKNINIVKKSGKLFIITCKTLIAGTELIYWPDFHSNPWTRKNKMDKTNCGGCNLKFAHPIYYRLHCCIFHDTNYSLTIRKYHCKVCGTAVLGKDNIMKHAAQSHAGRGAYQCQYCKKFFLRLNYLEMHRTYGCSKNPLRSRPLCDFCGRKFCQPQKLKVHIKRMHSDTSEVLEEFQCKLCTKLLGSRAALQRHMKEVHHKDVVGAAACDRCGKTFQNKSNLKIHMLTHSGVKPFKCKEIECKAAFTTKQCLQFHYKKVHGLNDEMMPKIERSIAYTFDAYSGGLVEDLGRGKIPKFNANEKEECNNVLDIDDDCSDKGSHDAPIIKSSRRMKKRKKKAMKEVSLNAKNKLEMAESSVGNIETNLMDTHGPACTTTEVIDKINERLSNKLDTESTLALNPESFNIDNIQSNGQENEEAPSTYQIPTDDDEKLGMSSCKRQESYNASLLVEAALDAAERDIGVVSIPSLEDNEHQGNADLYSGPSELAFKVADFQVAHESTAANVDSFVNDELVMSSATISNTRHVPPINGQCRSFGYAGTPMRLHSIEQYLEQEILTSPRYDEVAHFHANSNFQMLSQAHRLTIDPASGDESDSAVQNLSLSVKDKSIQQMEISKYNYEPDYNSTTNKSRVKFEPVATQCAREQGLDMSARGFQTSPEPQMQNSNHLHHYHHHHHNHNPYKIDGNERHGVDLSLSGSCVSPSYATIYPPYSHVDVSRVVNLEPTSRSHQLHTAVSRIIASPLPETLLTSLSTDSSTAEVRILPSSASPISTYNTSYSIGTTYHPTRSGYHYCNYY